MFFVGSGIPGDLTILGSVLDIYDATAQTSCIVNVAIGRNIDAFYFLDSSLKAQFAKGDVDGVMQTINMVSTVVGEKKLHLSP